MTYSATKGTNRLIDSFRDANITNLSKKLPRKAPARSFTPFVTVYKKGAIVKPLFLQTKHRILL